MERGERAAALHLMTRLAHTAAVEQPTVEAQRGACAIGRASPFTLRCSRPWGLVWHDATSHCGAATAHTRARATLPTHPQNPLPLRAAGRQRRRARAQVLDAAVRVRARHPGAARPLQGGTPQGRAGQGEHATRVHAWRAQPGAERGGRAGGWRGASPLATAWRTLQPTQQLGGRFSSRCTTNAAGGARSAASSPTQALHARPPLQLDAGKLVCAGATGNPVDGGLFVFKDVSERDIEEFVKVRAWGRGGASVGGGMARQHAGRLSAPFGLPVPGVRASPAVPPLLDERVCPNSPPHAQQAAC